MTIEPSLTDPSLIPTKSLEIHGSFLALKMLAR